MSLWIQVYRQEFIRNQSCCNAPPIPGEILEDELDELKVSPSEFARQIDVPPNRIGQIIAGRRPITADSALRFGHWFGVDPRFWINLQSQYDLADAHRRIGETVQRLPTASGKTSRRAR